MHHIIYSSRAVGSWTDDSLLNLLLQVRRNNAQQDVTGALVYGNGQFMQVLEGEEAVLQTLYARMQHDPRHTQLVKYADKDIADRSFGEWSMAFQPLTDNQFSGLMSYVPAEEFPGIMPDLGEADNLLLNLMKVLVNTPRA